MANVRIKDITTTASAPAADDYLAIDGATAGTRKISAANLGGDTLTTDVKDALLQIASKVAYIDDQGQTYYDDLYDALYPPAPPATLLSISAVYTQSGTVYDTDTLDSLKPDLVVTASYDDGTTQTVTTYMLSGELTVGTSTITVTYVDKTTTFDVTVTEQETIIPKGYVTNGIVLFLDGIKNKRTGHDATSTTWEDLSDNEYVFTNGGAAVFGDDGATFNAASGSYFSGIGPVTGADIKTIEVIVSPNNPSQALAITGGFGTSDNGNIFQKSSAICMKTGGTNSQALSTGVHYYANVFDVQNYKDGQTTTAASATDSYGSKKNSIMAIGARLNNSGVDDTNYKFKGKILAIRMYNIELSADQIAQNYAKDVERFGLS